MARDQVIAIIPARGGSKRIPNKNIRPFCGKPMIEYPIDAALKSEVFDRVVVSTDSQTIADIAKKVGAEVPTLRPSDLADDFTPTYDVLIHCLKLLQEREQLPRAFCCIYPATPLLKPEYLKESFSILQGRDAEAVFSVMRFEHPILRALHVADSGYLQMLWPENASKRTNDLQETFHDAGQFYWCNTEAFLKAKSLWGMRALPFPLSRSEALDIDTPEDWDLAERMMGARR